MSRAVRVTDDARRVVTLPAGPARRIVSLSPEVSENLFAIGAGRLVVGVTTADDYPAAVRSLTKVGDFGKPDYERIRALRPDVVVAASATIPPGEADQLQRRLGGIPVFQQKSVAYEDVARHLTQLGQLTGRIAPARQAAAAMEKAAVDTARRVAGRPRPTVFVQVSASPFYAAGPGSFVDDLIRRAGGTNVVRGSQQYPLYSKESLLAADPEHIVLATGGDMSSADPSAPPAGLPASLAARLKAVRAGNVHRIPSDLLFRPTPRLAQGLVLLAKTLHPEAYR